MGGYAAERVVLGDISSGAESDLRQATEIAFRMVAHFGMSDRVGPVFHEHKTEHPFLGQMLATEGGTSDATIHVIEQETRGMLNAAVDNAKRIVSEHRAELDRLVTALVEKETIDRDELRSLLGPPTGPSKPHLANGGGVGHAAE